MKQLFILLLSISGTVTAMAQIQFWNIEDIEDAHWAKARLQQKVKLMAIFQTDETGKRLDELTARDRRSYNNGGQLTAKRIYKTNWAKRSSQPRMVDSFIYNNKSQLTNYFLCSEPSFTHDYETVITYNAKGQQVKQEEYYTRNGEHTKQQSDEFIYNAKGQAIKVVSRNKEGKIDYTRQFTYTATGQLASAVFISDGLQLVNNYTWDRQGNLLSWQEVQDKQVQKTVSYSYDELGRRIKKQTTTNNDYADATVYTYTGNNMLPKYTALEYTGSAGKNDRRVEYNELVYEYY